MNISDRILQFIESKGISKNKFYVKTGLSNGFLDKKPNIGADKIEIIYSIYPEINLEWLITGTGTMTKENHPIEPQRKNEVTELLKKQIAELKESLKECRQDKNFMRSMLEDLKTERLPED